jgi:hypothetical protein
LHGFYQEELEYFKISSGVRWLFVGLVDASVYGSKLGLFLVVEEGTHPPAHHLPANGAEDCFSVFTFGLICRLVVAERALVFLESMFFGFGVRLIS